MVETASSVQGSQFAIDTKSITAHVTNSVMAEYKQHRVNKHTEEEVKAIVAKALRLGDEVMRKECDDILNTQLGEYYNRCCTTVNACIDKLLNDDAEVPYYS